MYFCGMKTYLFDTLNRFRRFSENLDVKATLCNKPWQVFNDSGEKELYIFQEDGTLLITYSGRVTHSTWQYIAANKSIIISAGEQSYMVHPAFMDNVLFALQVDGTNECAFLIDENNAQNFVPRIYTALMGYFEEKERRLIKEERRIKRALIEEEKRRKRIAEEERVHQLYERIKNDRIINNWGYMSLVFAVVGMLCYIVIHWNEIATIPLELCLVDLFFVGLAGALIGLFVGCFLVIFWLLYGGNLFSKQLLMRYIKRHLDGKVIDSLVDYHNRIVGSEWKKISKEELDELLYGK